MGHHANPKHPTQAKLENNHVTDKPIEPDDAADAQSRQRTIGKELRRWYDDIVKEPVPDDLLSLLEQLDHKKEG